MWIKVWWVSPRQRLGSPNALIFLYNHLFETKMRHADIFQQVRRILWVLGHDVPQRFIPFLRFYNLLYMERIVINASEQHSLPLLADHDGSARIGHLALAVLDCRGQRQCPGLLPMGSMGTISEP